MRNSPKSPKFPPRHLGDFGEFCKGLNKISVMLGLGVKVDIVESNRQVVVVSIPKHSSSSSKIYTSVAKPLKIKFFRI